jgi:hypothetical protein
MGSVRRRGDRVRISLENAEVALLTVMIAQVQDLLAAAPPADDGAATDDPSIEPDALERLLDRSLEPVEPPEDPVLLRLLPDAYRDDSDAAGEFRRLTEADLRATKRSGLSQIVTDLSTAGVPHRSGIRLELDDDAAAAWLPGLTDVRLVVGTRIGVTEDMDDERASLSVDSPRYAEIATYDWLSWLQDAMVRALTGD